MQIASVVAFSKHYYPQTVSVQAQQKYVCLRLPRLGC